MENAFFIMGGTTSQRLPITISKLHICTWNMRDCNAYFELGIEIAANTLSLNVDYSISFLAEWLTPCCEIISLHEKFADSDNARFIFNETVESTRDVNGNKHNGTRISFTNKRQIMLLPINEAKPQDGMVILTFNNKAPQGVYPYIRILIKTPLSQLAMIKKGIAKNSYVFDIKINEKRNLPNWVLDVQNQSNYQFCPIEKAFCLHAVPASYEISFIDSNKLKNVRKLEKSAFTKYLPEIKSIENDDYIITFSKSEDKAKSSYSFFSVFTQETIGTDQIIFSIVVNIICSLLFAIDSWRLACFEIKSWWWKFPWMFLIAVGIIAFATYRVRNNWRKVK